MNWKAEALDRLKNIKTKETAMVNMRRELRRLEKEAFDLRAAAICATRTQNAESKREDALINNIMRRQEITWAMENTRHWLSVTRQALYGLDPQEKRILRQLVIYPDGGGVEQLCRQLEVEKSTIYRRRDAALRKFTMAMYGAIDS